MSQPPTAPLPPFIRFLTEKRKLVYFHVVPVVSSLTHIRVSVSCVEFLSVHPEGPEHILASISSETLPLFLPVWHVSHLTWGQSSATYTTVWLARWSVVGGWCCCCWRGGALGGLEWTCPLWIVLFSLLFWFLVTVGSCVLRQNI